MTTITLYPDRQARCWMAHRDDEAARLAGIDRIPTPWTADAGPERVRQAIQHLNPRAKGRMCNLTHWPVVLGRARRLSRHRPTDHSGPWER